MLKDQDHRVLAALNDSSLLEASDWVQFTLPIQKQCVGDATKFITHSLFFIHFLLHTYKLFLKNPFTVIMAQWINVYIKVCLNIELHCVNRILPVKMLDDVAFKCFFVVFSTEFDNANARLPYHFFGHREHDSNVIRIFKAFARQTKDALLPHQCLHEFKFIVKFWEILNIDADHHVHGAIWHDWTQTVRFVEYLECKLGMFLQRERENCKRIFIGDH